MDLFIYVALLFSAVSHAGWNAVVKSGFSRYNSMALISLFTFVVSGIFLPFVEVLDFASFIWICVSLCFHFFYKLCLSEAYRVGDFAQIYPIARGGAPLLVMFGAYFLLGERISFLAIFFIIVLVIGVWLASYKGGVVAWGSNKRAIIWALLTAFFIGCYSISDGVGVRVSGSSFAYIVWLMSLDGLLFLLFVYFRSSDRVGLSYSLLSHWRIGFVGGGLSFIAYGIAIWAMERVPLALVSGLRETSILFAILLAWLFVGEVMNRYRVIAAVLIVFGVVGIKFA